MKSTTAIVKKTSGSKSKALSPFNIKRRYRKLNEDQKGIVVKKYQEIVGKNERSFYNALDRIYLSDSELIFFSDIFDCSIKDLYNTPPKKVQSVFTLERIADGFAPGKQNNLEI